MILNIFLLLFLHFWQHIGVNSTTTTTTFIPANECTWGVYPPFVAFPGQPPLEISVDIFGEEHGIVSVKRISKTDCHPETHTSELPTWIRLDDSSRKIIVSPPEDYTDEAVMEL